MLIRDGILKRTCPEHAFIDVMIVGPGSINSKDEEGYTKEETEQNTDSLYCLLFNPEK